MRSGPDSDSDRSLSGVLEPLRVAPLEHQLVVPRRRGAPELDVEPVERGLDVVGPMEPGHAEQTDAVGLPQEAEHLARGVVDLLVAPGVGHFVVEPVLNQDGARREHRDNQVAVHGQAVFLAGEEPEARMEPDRETARRGLDAFPHAVLATETPGRDAADASAAGDHGRDALIERRRDERHLAGARVAGDRDAGLVDLRHGQQVIDDGLQREGDLPHRGEVVLGIQRSRSRRVHRPCPSSCTRCSRGG